MPPRALRPLLTQMMPSCPVPPQVRKNFVGYVIDARRAAGEAVDREFLVTMTLGALQVIFQVCMRCRCASWYAWISRAPHYAFFIM